MKGKIYIHKDLKVFKKQNKYTSKFQLNNFKRKVEIINDKKKAVGKPTAF